MRDDRGGILVLASGGLDSAVLLHHLADEGQDIHPVFVRQGFPWERAELEGLRRFLEESTRPEFRPLEVLVAPLADLLPEEHFARRGPVPAAGTPDEDCYLPGRNVTLLGKAAVRAAALGVGTLALGPLRGNPFPDATPAFLAKMAEALSEGLGRPFRIRAPFLAFTKDEVLLLGRDLPLETTLSCLAPVEGGHCGRCAKCGERREAYRRAGLPDPTRYAG